MRKDIIKRQETLTEDYQNVPSNIHQQLEQFQNDKIGVIFHFGLYSIAGIVESWQLSKEDTWARKNPWRSDLQQLRIDYWNLAQDFHPNKENIASWSSLLKHSGIKYGILTTKHHDGFNLFDTKYSNFKTTKYNHGIDVFKVFTDSFNQQNLKIGAYYSKPDWHNPYYWEPGSNPRGRYASYDPYKKPKKWQLFNDFVQNQLLEIASNYGKIDILWLDGGWVNKDNNEFLDMNNIVTKIRQQQPNILVVDRTIGGQYEDYVTPERSIPEEPPKKVWESNIPLAKNWGYVPNDQYKSFAEILDTVVKIVAKGGNVILGIGPKPDGTLPNQAIQILKKLGKWLQINGKCIYNTRAIKIDNPPKGWFFTCNKNHLYAIVRQNGNKYWNTTSLNNKIINITVLNHNQSAANLIEDKLFITQNSIKEQYTVLDILCENSL